MTFLTIPNISVLNGFYLVLLKTMTSMYGSMGGSFSDAELATKKTVSSNKIVFSDTILYSLFSSPEYQQFANLVSRIKTISGKLNSRDAEFTIFVPIELYILDKDIYAVEKFVKSHMYSSTIPLSLLKSSKMLQLKGNLNNMPVYSTFDGCHLQVNGSNILQQEVVGKSILYLIDKPLFCMD
jgi:hypothetical protein